MLKQEEKIMKLVVKVVIKDKKNKWKHISNCFSFSETHIIQLHTHSAYVDSL